MATEEPSATATHLTHKRLPTKWQAIRSLAIACIVPFAIAWVVQRGIGLSAEWKTFVDHAAAILTLIGVVSLEYRHFWADDMVEITESARKEQARLQDNQRIIDNLHPGAPRDKLAVRLSVDRASLEKVARNLAGFAPIEKLMKMAGIYVTAFAVALLLLG